MTLDVADPFGGRAPDGTLARLREAVRPRREVAGWATVELDRAEAAFRNVPVDGLSAQAEDAVARVDSRDELLGAFARVIRDPDGREIALLEPFTEGRLAASLARHGEGFAALYLIADAEAPALARAAGVVLSAPGLGPFGTQRLVVGGPRSGPFFIIATVD